MGWSGRCGRLRGRVTRGAEREKTYTPPRTAWGDPDLQGDLAEHGHGRRAVRAAGAVRQPPRFSPTRNSGSGRRTRRNRPTLDNESFSVDDVKPEVVAIGDVGGQTSPPPFWLERGEPSRQSSLVVDPPDGQLPPMTPDGVRRVARRRTPTCSTTGFNAASDLGPYDRCISRGVLGSMFPVIYNNGNQIIQTPGYVVLRNEMIHETRVIPLDGRPQLSSTTPVVHGRLARPLGGQHARRRTRRTSTAQRARRPTATCMIMSDALEIDGEVHAHGARHDAVRSDGERSEDVDEAVDGVISAAGATRATGSSNTPATKAITRCRTSCRDHGQTKRTDSVLAAIR